MKTVKPILRDTWRYIEKARLLQVAGSLAYTTILSLIPALAISFAIFQAFGGLESLYTTIEPFILSNLAQSATDEVMAKFRSFISNAQGGVIGAGGLLALILTTMSMLYSIEVAINQVWEAPVTRGWFHRLSAYWLIITLGPLAMAVVVGYASSKEYPLTRFLPSGTGIFVMTIAIFYLVFRYVPNRKVRPQYALISALITALFWNLARLAFGLYTRSVVSYDKIYGSLAAVPVILLWIYVIWVIVLIGVSFSAALQKRFEGHL